MDWTRTKTAPEWLAIAEEDVDVTRAPIPGADLTHGRTADEWLETADQWHWQAVELHCDGNIDRRRLNLRDIAVLQSFADYALRRAAAARPDTAA